MSKVLRIISLNFCLIFLSIGVVQGSNISYVNHAYRTTLEQNFINNPASVMVALEDPLRQDPSSLFAPVSYKWKIKLVYGREDKSDVAGNYFSYEVNYELKDEDGFTLKTGVLTINHSENSGIYEAMEIYEGSAATGELFITSICGGAEGNSPLPCLGSGTSSLGFDATDIRIELELDVERYYELSHNDDIPDLYNEPIYTEGEASHVDLAWSYVPGFEEYELEYVFWDIKATDLPAITQTDLLFENSIRISTWKNHFQLNVTYPEGTLYYRVRGVGKFINNVGSDYSIKKYGRWSDIRKDDIGDSFILKPFESGKNWQYTVKFAEDGKYKKVMSYYDASLRNRQVLTNLNDSEMTLVAETDYSIEGQGVLSILPSPIGNEGTGPDQNNLFFKEAFNKNTSGTTYSYRDFDKNGGASPLGTMSGAGQYYSPNNVSEGIYKNYISNSFQFPLTQARYLRDATGRMSAQGGVGNLYQLGTDRETRYYYLDAKESELRRLFGSNVGDASHYKKNLVVDPNGQVSSSYLDQSGRVIATALLGAAPTNVNALSENVLETATLQLGVDDEVTTTFRKSTNLIFNPVINTVFDFNYSLTGVFNVIDLQALQTVCETCEYELTITIKDEEGVEVAGVPSYPILGNGGVCPDPIPNEPSSTNLISDPSFSFSVTLPNIGTYQVIKELKLVGDPTQLEALQTYLLDNYPNQLPDLQTYIDNAVNSIDYSQCIWSCAEFCNQKAIDDNPSWFDVEGILQPGFEQQYNDFMFNCSTTDCLAEVGYDPFEQAAITECESSFEQMRVQVSPEGNDLFPNITTDNFGPDDIDFANPISYNDLFGLTFLIEDVDGEIHAIQGGVFITPPNAAPDYILPTEISILNATTGQGSTPFPAGGFLSNSNNNYTYVFNTDYWQDQWADALVELHREYCFYEVCLETNTTSNNSETSYDYNLKLFTAPSWSEVNGVSYNTFVWTSNPNQNNSLLIDMIGEDPFFTGTSYQHLGDCGNQSRADEIEENLLENYPLPTSVAPSGMGSIFQFVDHLQSEVQNSQNPPYDLSNVDALQEFRWNIIRGAYMNEKQRISLECTTCPNGLYSDERAIFSLPPFVDITDQTALNNYINNDLGNEVDAICADHCNEKAAMWVQQIQKAVVELGCAAIPDQSTANLAFALNSHCDALCNMANINPQFPNCLSYFSSSGILDEIDVLTACDPTLVLETIESWNIDIGGVNIDPCFVEVVEAMNNEILPYNCNNTIIYDNVTAEDCFDEIKILQEISSNDPVFYSFIKLKEPTCVDINTNNTSITYGFGFRDADANLISLCDIRRIKNLRVSSEPNTFIADDYFMGIACTIVPNSCEDSEYTAYIVSDGKTTCDFVEEEDPCAETLILEATTLATEQWQNDMDAILTEFYNAQGNCMNVNETFSVSYSQSEFHYTLYYYDQAGDLVQTVPPVGVQPLAWSSMPNGVWNGTSEPQHTQITNYKYNSIQQVREQDSPDGGLTSFHYNTAGQLRLSQNAKQLADGNHYSYKKYDEQARIKELGQVEGVSLGINLALLDNPNFPTASNSLTQRIITTYDDPSTTTISQINSRGRVTSTYNDHLTTHYAYDVHGNVKEILHEYGELPFTIGDVNIKYEYDLISRNVNEVQYQPNKYDQYYHSYDYDADNRLTHVYTSADGEIWEKDARYFYYAHGPLARVEVGHDKVQGMDYYYNLQGWIKGVNQTGPNSHTYEMGADGHNPTTNINRNIARDEFAYSLGYNISDYSPIGGSAVNLGPVTQASWSNFAGDILEKTFGNEPSLMGLVNGNITRTTTDIKHFYDTGIEGLQTLAYQYDQLHRITKSFSYHYDAASGNWTKNNNYNTSYSYDGNGNLGDLSRNGHLGEMDDLTYNYNPNKPNQLLHVDDTSGADPALYDNDVDGGQIGNNYQYDEIGNLISDNSEHIAEVQWNVQGKVDTVIFNTAGQALGRKNIYYTYDPAGNRLTKKVGENDDNITYYVRDASGKIMSIYETGSLIVEDQGFTGIHQKEVPSYGSSRIGIQRFTKRFISQYYSASIPTTLTRKRGKKIFEMSNHLSNVLVTLRDKVQGISTGGNANEADYYEAIVVSANDYYPFGMAMPDRTYSSPDYRYGFNGKENDRDWGAKWIQDYGFRLYNPSIARFLSVDPLSQSYPWYTPYQFAGNKPVIAVDLDGLEEKIIIYNLYKTAPDIQITTDGEVEIQNYVLIKEEYGVNAAHYANYSIEGLGEQGTLHIYNIEGQEGDIRIYDEGISDSECTCVERRYGSGFGFFASWGKGSGSRLAADDGFELIDVEEFSGFFNMLNINFKIPNPFVKAPSGKGAIANATRFYHDLQTAPYKYSSLAKSNGVLLDAFDKVALYGAIYGNSASSAAKSADDILNLGISDALREFDIREKIRKGLAGTPMEIESFTPDTKVKANFFGKDTITVPGNINFSNGKRDSTGRGTGVFYLNKWRTGSTSSQSTIKPGPIAPEKN